jgi:hypothetical protein
MLDDKTTDTVSEVQEFYQRARKLCEPWHNKILHRRKLYNGDHYKGRARDGEERYVDPTYQNVVDLGIGIVLANDMEWKVSGWAPTPMEQADSEQVEKFLAGLLQIASDREEVYLPYEILLNFMRDGCGVIYTVWDEQLALRVQDTFEMVLPAEDPEAPEEVEMVPGYQEPPVRAQAIDPLKIFMLPGGPGRWGHIFRVEQMSVAEVETRWGTAIKSYLGRSRADKENSNGELIDYWRYAQNANNETGKIDIVVEHAMVFDNTEIFALDIEADYDELPFTIGFFKPTDSNDPKGWGESLIDPLEETVAMLEKSFNRRHHQVTKYTGLPLVVEIQPGRTVNIDPAYGSYVTVNPGERVGFPTWQGNPPDVEMEMQFLRARAQQSGFSDVMFGAGPSAVSGYGLSQLGDQNRIRLEQPVRHLVQFWQRWAKKVLRLVERKAGDKVVRVYGKLRGQDFAEQVFNLGLAGYNVQCEIKPEFPNEKSRKHAMATQVAGILSATTIMEEYLDIDQPQDEFEKRMIEQARQDPTVQHYAKIKMLQALAKEGDSAAALALQQLAQQGAPGQKPGPDKDPRRPEQMVGMQSPTGQPTPQAMGGMPPGQDEMSMMQSMANAAPGMTGE